jgi:hypothetical protein
MLPAGYQQTVRQDVPLPHINTKEKWNKVSVHFLSGDVDAGQSYSLVNRRLQPFPAERNDRESDILNATSLSFWPSYYIDPFSRLAACQGVEGSKDGTGSFDAWLLQEEYL